MSTEIEMDVPVPFDGTPEQAHLNIDTHQWGNYDSDIVCVRCDAKFWHEAARYKCGADVPRQIVTVYR